MASLPLFEPVRDPAAERLWTVSELTTMVKEILESGFGDVGICGEVSNLARPRSGHIYFCLKDSSAQIKAVLWRSMAQRLVFELTDGLAIRAWGALNVYAARGEYQLVVRKLEPEGIGALVMRHTQFRQQQTRELLRRPLLAGFDLAHRVGRAADALSQRLLRQVELLAPGFQPPARRT